MTAITTQITKTVDEIDQTQRLCDKCGKTFTVIPHNYHEMDNQCTAKIIVQNKMFVLDICPTCAAAFFPEKIKLITVTETKVE